MTIEELFGTLQQSITVEWRKHLQTGKYSKHMALDEFYKEMPEKIDALIEAYQADNDIVKDYKNVLDDGLDALEYMQELKKTVKEGRKLFDGESELESLTDDILGLIDSTIYKLKHLKESMISLHDFIVEALDESVMDVNLDVSDEDIIVGRIVAYCEKVKPAGGCPRGNVASVQDDWMPAYHDIHNAIKSVIKKSVSAAKIKKDNLAFIGCYWEPAGKFTGENGGIRIFAPTAPEGMSIRNCVSLRACPGIQREDITDMTKKPRGTSYYYMYPITTELAHRIIMLCDQNLPK